MIKAMSSPLSAPATHWVRKTTETRLAGLKTSKGDGEESWEIEEGGSGHS